MSEVAVGLVCLTAGFIAGAEWLERKLRREGKVMEKGEVEALRATLRQTEELVRDAVIALKARNESGRNTHPTPEHGTRGNEGLDDACSCNASSLDSAAYPCILACTWV